MNNLVKLVNEPIPFAMKVWIKGKERNSLRAMFRKALKQGNFYYRRTYYDYYDSCHKPVETPDAPWQLTRPGDRDWARDLKAGGPSIYRLPDGTYELRTSYSTYNVKIA